MDLDKIGKYIAYNRKNRGLTQQQLAEKLGVTNKTISRWETGKYMPDLSLLKPLSEELGITLNELLSGEKNEKERIVENTEKSIITTIDYTKQIIERVHSKISIGLIVAGIFISMSALIIFEAESSWSCIYSVIGIIVLIVGIISKFKYSKKLKILISVVLFIGIFLLFMVVDYVGVKVNPRPPIYSYLIITEFRESKIIEYKSLFCNVYRINADTTDEYYIVDDRKEYTMDTIQTVYFNEAEGSVDNIFEGENEYVVDNEI